MTQRQSDLFDDQVTPLKVGFWSQPNHWLALECGLGANEAEALRWEYQLVLHGAGDRLTGRPCLCNDIEKWPEAIRGGLGGTHDSMGAVVGLISDLKCGADALPVRWRETQRVFVIQGRGEIWRTRVGLCLSGRQYRPEDLMPDLGRQHAWGWAAYVLGWRGRCRWPKRVELARAA